MTIVESMACATPVIVSNTPNLTEVIKDGDNGYAFQTGDATELQAVVAKYAQMSQQEYEALQQAEYKRINDSLRNEEENNENTDI